MSKKNNLGLIIGILVAAVLVSLALVFHAIVTDSQTAELSANGQEQAETLQNGQLLEQDLAELAGDNFYLGDDKAPITFIEYSDYTCGWCRKFSSDILPKLKADYIDKGLVKFVYVPFTSSRPNSQLTAKASYCAGKEQGNSGFFKMHDGIFASADMSLNSILNLASKQGLNKNDFEGCLEDANTNLALKNEVQKAYNLGVRGTPNLIINGLVITGFIDYENLQGILKNLENAQ